MTGFHMRGISTPAVSVVLAVFNGERFLQEAITSVLAQTLTNFEFVIVDDGSTDGTAEILASCADTRVKVLRNPRCAGLFPSLNRGIAAASADLIARLDADDVCEPERLATQVAFLHDHPDIALVGSAYREIDEHGRERLQNELPSEETDLRWSMLFFCPFAHSSVVFRRGLLARTVGLYDERLRYAGDLELWFRIAASLRLTNLREPLVRIRVHSGSMTAAEDERTNEGTELHVRELQRLLGWTGRSGELFDRYRYWFDVVYGHVAVTPAEVDQVKALHDAFCADRRIGTEERRRHWDVVRTRLGYRLASGA